MLPYSIFSQPWILKRSPLQVSASPVVCSEQWFRFGSSFAHYCPEAIEYSSQQFRIYPPCLWLFGHWPLFFLCLPPSLVGQKKKKEVKKEKVILFSYESSVPQNCLLDWQLSLLVIHLFKLGGGNYPVFPLGVKSYG